MRKGNFSFCYRSSQRCQNNGNRRSDIGSYDNTDGHRQGDDARMQSSQRHDDHGMTGLYDSSDDDADQKKSYDAVMTIYRKVNC